MQNVRMEPVWTQWFSYIAVKS